MPDRGGGSFRPGGGPPPPAPSRNFGPPKKKGSDADKKRWEAKEKGPKGPLKERFSGRLGGLYDDGDDSVSLSDFDDPAATAHDDDE